MPLHHISPQTTSETTQAKPLSTVPTVSSHLLSALEAKNNALTQVDQILPDLQTIHYSHRNHHHNTELLVQTLSQSFSAHLHTLHRLWDWGEEHETSDLPSFAEWLDTPVEPTLLSFSSANIIVGVNALDTQILRQSGWYEKQISSTHAPKVSPSTHLGSAPEPGSKHQTSDSYPNPRSIETIASGETAFKVLLKDVLSHVAQCREVLAQLELIQTRSHQTVQSHEHCLHYAEDIVASSKMQSLDRLFHELCEQWNQTSKHHPLLIKLVGPHQKLNLKIDHHKYETLLHGLSELLNQRFAQILTRRHLIGSTHAIASNIPTTDQEEIASTLTPELSEAVILTLTPSLNGPTLIIEWQEQASSPLAIMANSTRMPSHLILKTPLAPAQITQLVCRAQDALYGISVQQVKHLIVPTMDQLTMGTGGVLRLQWQFNQENQYLQVYPLSQLLQYSASASIVGDRHRHKTPTLDSPVADTSSSITPLSPILLLKTNGQWVGIMVDEVLEKRSVILRPLGKAIASPPWIQGCALVNTEQLALSLDLSILLQKTVGLEV